MPAARTMPVPAEHREFTVKVNGQAVGREHHLLAVSVSKAVNRVSSARLAYLDGSASAGDFPLSNAATFVPGQRIEILAGTVREPVSLFRGLVVRQAIKIRDAGAPQLVVECRHQAAKLTVGCRNAHYFDQTDSETIESLLSRAEIEADVERSSTRHAQQVQYRSTDWDFLLARANAVGKLVFTNDAGVSVKAPPAPGTPACELLFGATVLEMDAEIDARLQFAAVKAVTWDPGAQNVLEAEGIDPGVRGPGNLTGSDLASVVGLDAERLLHASLTEAEARDWASAVWMRSRLNQVSGRVKCEGIATVNPGDFVTVNGVGERFSGKVFVTGVRHEFDGSQGWKTHVQFGAADRWSAAAHAVSAAPAGALLPAVNGLQIGKVVSNGDPAGEHRVRVRFPLVDNAGDGVWARVATLDAGDDRGTFFRPEIGDEVVVGFLDDDPRQAVLLGMLHSSAKAPPLAASDDNHEKVYQSRSKMRIYFDDEKKILQIDTPAGNRVALDEDAQGIAITDQNGNAIELTPDGITIKSDKAIEMKAGTELTLTGSSAAELSSDGGLIVKGSTVNIN